MRQKSPAHIFGVRLPSTERIATSIGWVGGRFHSRSKFGAGESGSNFSLILISE
jgi:hypothetical protein